MALSRQVADLKAIVGLLTTILSTISLALIVWIYSTVQTHDKSIAVLQAQQVNAPSSADFATLKEKMESLQRAIDTWNARHP